MLPGVDGKPLPGEGMVPRHRFVKLFRDATTWRVVAGTMIIFVFGLALIGISFAPWFPSVRTSWLAFSVRELGGGLLVAALAGLLIQLLVQRYRQQFSEGMNQFVEQDVMRSLAEIRADIGHQTELLVQGSATLEAVQRTGVSGVWQSRGDALAAMKRDLEDRDLRSVRIMGISLNDFLRVDQHHSLHTIWRLISNYLRGERPPQRSALDVRVLIIDPNCLGALLRSFGEAREDDYLAGRLDEDVTATARRLAALKADVAARAEAHPELAVTFDFRLYRVAPTVFMISTGKAAYMQTYYFWSKRQFEASMPVMRFDKNFGVEAMEKHFDLLWHHASVDGDAWLKAQEIGLERGSYESGMVNLFTDQKKSEGRLSWLIEHAKTRVYLMGISLRSYFEPGPLCFAVQRAMNHPGLDMRILLLDPDGIQASYRSFREHQFADHCGRRYRRHEEYVSNPECHQQSRLVQDTRDSIRHIQALRRRPLAGGIELGLYDSSPSCFLMIADDHALVEQYHYGKDIPDGTDLHGTPPVLGKDMALVEFAKTPEDDPFITLTGTKNSFNLVLDHFNWVFKYCAKPCPPEAAGVPEDITDKATAPELP